MIGSSTNGLTNGLTNLNSYGQSIGGTSNQIVMVSPLFDCRSNMRKKSMMCVMIFWLRI
jgi:hypothetical protein